MSKSDELLPCPFCGKIPDPIVDATNILGKWRLFHRCKIIGPSVIEGYDRESPISMWNTRADLHAAEIARLTEENARLREALEAKPWPPSDVELREMLATIVGAWWSEATAKAIRDGRINREDAKAMHAIRQCLAPFIASAALQENDHE